MKLGIITELPYKNKGALIKFLKAQKFDYKMQVRNNPGDKAAAWRFDRTSKAIIAITENSNFRLGHCVVCGQKIPRKRLLADPETVWCIECAKKMDQKSNENWLQTLITKFLKGKSP